MNAGKLKRGDGTEQPGKPGLETKAWLSPEDISK